ncbi:hypothetical protein F4Z99_18465 [Candidatus Poribacteria bacterium]|nr:hypothetical protein [Candidatus Poribacteria bacterium]
MEGILYDLAFTSPAPDVAITEVPPEIQKQLWGDRDELIETLAWALPQGIKHNDLTLSNLYFEQLCLLDQRLKYYTKYIDAGGIAVIGNEIVPDEAFLMAREIVLEMTSKHPEIRDMLSPETGHYHVLVNDQYGHLRETPEPPHYEPDIPYALSHCGGRYTYCVSTIRPLSEGRVMWTFVHEFAHAMHSVIEELDTSFNDKLKQAYENAIEQGIWSGMYAEENYQEYWAEGVRMWFYHVTDLPRPPTQGWVTFRTYEDFAERDPMLVELIRGWFHEATFFGRY